MAPKPKYVTELEKKMAGMEISIKEVKTNQDGNKLEHAEIMKSLTTIKVCLAGSELDEEGGLVKEVHQNTKCINHMKRSQARREGFIGALSMFLAAAVTLVVNWLVKKNGG